MLFVNTVGNFYSTGTPKRTTAINASGSNISGALWYTMVGCPILGTLMVCRLLSGADTSTSSTFVSFPSIMSLW